MSAETTVVAALLASGAVTAIVGAAAAARIYPDEAPEEAAPPLLVYERGGTRLEYTLLTNQVAASSTPITVTAWARKRLDAETLADAVMAAMLAAGVPALDRDGDYDDGNQAYGAVVTFEIWETS